MEEKQSVGMRVVWAVARAAVVMNERREREGILQNGCEIKTGWLEEFDDRLHEGKSEEHVSCQKAERENCPYRYLAVCGDSTIRYR